jgi:hypothetical protein
LTFGLAVAPRQFQGGFNRLEVREQSDGEAAQLRGDGRSASSCDPTAQTSGLPLFDQITEVMGQFGRFGEGWTVPANGLS